MSEYDEAQRELHDDPPRGGRPKKTRFRFNLRVTREEWDAFVRGEEIVLFDINDPRRNKT
jgi:hypothetical protein